VSTDNSEMIEKIRNNVKLCFLMRKSFWNGTPGVEGARDHVLD